MTTLFETFSERISSDMMTPGQIRSLVNESDMSITDFVNEWAKKVQNIYSSLKKPMDSAGFTNFVCLIGESSTDIDELCALRDIMIEVLYSAHYSVQMFYTSVVVNNKIVDAEKYVMFTGVETLLPLRESFWDGVNGEILRQKLYAAWMDNDGREVAEADLPFMYAYKIWVEMSLPEELETLKPTGFNDRLIP